MAISEIKLIGKTKEYKLFEFFNEDTEVFQTLKVMTNPRLFDLEKQILNSVQNRSVTISMLNDFVYE